MINRLSKNPRKKTSKKKSVKKVSKRKFKNPDENEDYTPEESAKLKSLILSQLNEWRKQNSGENYEPFTLNLIANWKKEVEKDWDNFLMSMYITSSYSNSLMELMHQFADGKPIKIQKYATRFD